MLGRRVFLGDTFVEWRNLNVGVPLLVLLVGLLIPSCLVLGQNTSDPTTSDPTTNDSTSTTSSSLATTQPLSPMPSSSTPTTDNMSTMLSSTTWVPMGNMNSTMINCPLITCNYSDCYTSYQSNMNSSWCSSDSKYCQVLRQTDMCYIVSCTASCMDMCTNTSQNNCSLACCNSTDCMDTTFNAMMMQPITTTVMPTPTPAPTTTPTTATATTNPATTPDNRNQCHTGVCSDTADCYKSITAAEKCTSDQKYCQLKKELIDSKVKWTTGCTTNCSSETWCTSTTTACHQECCLSAKTSCLAMNGTLNVPSSATRGPRFRVDLIVLLICLLVVSGLYTI